MGGPSGRWSRTVMVVFLVLLAGAPSTSARGAAPGSAAPAMGSIGMDLEPQVGADERRLVPVRDLDATVVRRIPATAPGAWSVLADGPSFAEADDATFVELAGDPGSRVRVGLSRAPSGVVTRLLVGVRVRAVDGPASVSLRLVDDDRALLPDADLAIRPADGWQSLVIELPSLSPRGAASLGVEVAPGATGDDSGTIQVSQLWAQVRLRVSLSFASTPVVGGGRITALAQAAPTSALLVGTASGGVFRAVGRSGRFAPRDAAFDESDQLRIASIVRHPTRARELLLAAGDHGRSGWLFRSTDDGWTWALVAGRMSFSAAVAPRPDEPPPAMGTLLALADAPDGTTTIWAATTGNGLMRSTDDGRTWRSLGLGARVLRGLAADPTSPDTLYLATAGSGTWRVDGAWGETPVFRSVPGGPRDPEELAWVGGALVVAGGDEGLFRLDGDHLVLVDPGLGGNAVHWTTVAGAETRDGSLLVAAGMPAATEATPPAGAAFIPMVRSLDGGVTWTPATTPDRVDVSSLGDGTWPLGPGLASTAPGGPAFHPLHVLVVAVPDAAADAAIVHLGTDGGLWSSTDGGRSWQPRLDGLGGVGARGARPLPGPTGGWVTSQPGVGTIVGSADLRSVGLVPWASADLPTLADPVATDIAFDPGSADGPGDAVLAIASTVRPPAGEVVVTPAAAIDAGGQATGFGAAFPETRPTAVAVGRDASGLSVIVAMLHPDGGVARRVGDGPWERTAAGSIGEDPRTIARGDLAWIPGTQTIYAFDPGTGVHRSLDAGASWQRIWGARSNRPVTARLATGIDPGVVFASTSQGLYRLDGADRGTVEDGSIVLTRLGTFPKPGPITLDGDGRLWVVAEPLAGAPARLAVSWDPAASEPVFHDLASEWLVNAIVAPDAIGVDAEGRVLLADGEVGLSLGLPVDRLVEPWLPPDIVIHPLVATEGEPVAIEPVDPTVIVPLLDPIVLHVAADGDDAADGGTRERALASLVGAHRLLEARYGAAAEGLEQDVHVLVHAGRYAGQSVRWTFTRADRIVRIEGVPDGADATKPRFVGCVDPACASTRPWLSVSVGRGEPTNVQIVNVQVALYHRAVVFEGGPDPALQWNGRNVIHRSAFHAIGTGFRREITPDVWSAGIWILHVSRDNRIVGNRVTDSFNRMDHANEWFHTVYASRGATGNVVERNLVLRTSGDFHVRDGADGNVFARNLIVGSFYLAIVTEWSAADETDVCDTHIEANVVIGEWRGQRRLVPWSSQTASPDGRCAAAGLPSYVEPAPNLIIARVADLGAHGPG